MTGAAIGDIDDRIALLESIVEENIGSRRLSGRGFGLFNRLVRYLHAALHGVELDAVA